MKWPTAILLSVLAASLAFATVQFAGCAKVENAQHEACVQAATKSGALVYPSNTGGGPVYVVVTPC